MRPLVKWSWSQPSCSLCPVQVMLWVEMLCKPSCIKLMCVGCMLPLLPLMPKVLMPKQLLAYCCTIMQHGCGINQQTFPTQATGGVGPAFPDLNWRWCLWDSPETPTCLRPMVEIGCTRQLVEGIWTRHQCWDASQKHPNSAGAGIRSLTGCQVL